MKRFHVHLSVKELPESIRFYSRVFGCEPTVVKDDYAKWMLEDPRLNFAISTREAKLGLNHLGLQVDCGGELQALESQLRAADVDLVTQNETTCCYARSDKYWVTDPQGVAWETFHTLETAPTFSMTEVSASPCCAPREATAALPQRPSATRAGGCCA
jgi:lactoylglutathione lyase